jgi:hypothetical protein
VVRPFKAPGHAGGGTGAAVGFADDWILAQRSTRTIYFADVVAAFSCGLRDVGYVDGQNVTIE